MSAGGNAIEGSSRAEPGAPATVPQAEVVAAPPIQLHTDDLERIDANSPIHRHAGRLYLFYSHYVPIGHSHRRVGTGGLDSLGPPAPVRILDDPDPRSGKWIESVWRAPDGRLYGWYHAEELASCPTRLFLPHIGALVSDDDGATWRCLGELLRADPAEMDCGWQNGFLAGGYGDFCVLPDRAGRYLYLHYSSYVHEPSAQGVCVARFPAAARDRPDQALECWRDGVWQPAAGERSAPPPAPLWPARRSWQHADPEGFWGPAVHYNRDLGAYVMLLNCTAGGNHDLRQDSVHVSFAADLADPAGWSTPEPVVKGGFWYPQVMGLGPEDTNTLAGARARMFMMGFSAWEIRFSRRPAGSPPPPPLPVPRAAISEAFGTPEERRRKAGLAPEPGTV